MSEQPGYNDIEEEEAYEGSEGDQDAEGASTPDEEQPDQAEG
jgi:hypothetical protein